jgi:hypothetical protein
MAPGVNPAAATGPTYRFVAVDATPLPLISGTAAAATPPLPLGVAPLRVDSRLVRCDPDAKVICSAPHASNSRETVASTTDLAWPTATAGAPARSGSTFVPDFLAKLEIQPRSIHGAGGVDKGNRPSCAASKIVGNPAVRFTGAKYARTRRVIGVSAVTTPAAVVTVLTSHPLLGRRISAPSPLVPDVHQRLPLARTSGPPKKHLFPSARVKLLARRLNNLSFLHGVAS